MVIQNNVDLHTYSTFGLRAKAKYLATITKDTDIPDLATFIEDINAPALNVGGGSNMLFCTDYPGVLIKNAMDSVSLHGKHTIRCGAGAYLDDVVAFSVQNNLYGLEPLSYIPGTIGGAIVLNAGAYGANIGHYLKAVRAYDTENNRIVILDASELNYWHRTSIFRSQHGSRWIIMDADLHVSVKPIEHIHPKINSDLHGQELRDQIKILRSHLPNPSEQKNAGSFFLNPTVTNLKAENIRKSHSDASMRPYNSTHHELACGWFIEQAGLKGARINGFHISDKHANIVINENERATGRDVRKFVDAVNERVGDMFGITLQPEPLLVGGEMFHFDTN